MADVSINVGVTGISEFKSGMSDAQASIKGLDAALKLNEKQLKASGNAEKELNDRTDLLNRKLEAQKRLLKNAQDALNQMSENGVKKSSKAYQDMQRKVLEAQSAIMDTQADIQNMGESAAEAAGKTDQLATSLGGLNKKVSLEQVSSVVDKISGGLEKGAKKAIELGKAIWENITDVARFSDDTATQAMILDMSVEDYQAYKKVFDTTAEMTVQEWQKAKQKVQKAIHDPTDDQTTIMELLGVKTHGAANGKYGVVYGVARDFETVFWEIGKALKDKVESGEMTQDVADTYANELFGKTFANLKPIFDMGEKEFQRQVDEQIVMSEEAIKKNAELNDTLVDLKSDFESLKGEVLSGLAPALTKGAESLDSLLARIMEWLETPEGKEALKDMETAVSGLFDDLGKIDPEQVVSGFTSVFNTIVGGLEWLVENKDAVGDALKTIVGVWAGLTLTGGALDMLKLVNGLKDLLGLGAGAAAGGAAGAAGTGGGTLAASLSTALMATIQKVVPVFGSAAMQTSLPGIGDWLMNQTDVGMWLRGTKKPEETWNEFKENVQHNAETFESDWQNNAIYKALLAWGENNIRYWDQINKTNQLAAEWTLGDEFTADELMQMINNGNPVPIPTDLDLETTAEDLAGEIGTVTVPVVLVPSLGGESVNKTQQRRRNANSPFGFANGLPMTPFDGWYFLHQGETVSPAREVASRNYNSNLYVENMNMGSGQDARGLAEQMAAAQRRQSAGFGG